MRKYVFVLSVISLFLAGCNGNKTTDDNSNGENGGVATKPAVLEPYSLADYSSFDDFQFTIDSVVLYNVEDTERLAAYPIHKTVTKDGFLNGGVALGDLGYIDGKDIQYAFYISGSRIVKADTAWNGITTYSVTSGYIVVNGKRYALGFETVKRDYMGNDYYHSSDCPGKMSFDNVGDELEFYWMVTSDPQDTVMYSHTALRTQ